MLVTLMTLSVSVLSQTLKYEFNGVEYSFPSSHAAGELTNNGSGTLIWDVVPANMGTYFTGACPAGWTESVAAAGRMVVARAGGGTSGSTVGIALTNAENRTHDHSISSSGSSTHGGATSGSVSQNFQEANGTGSLEFLSRDTHTHSISSNGTHDHGSATGLETTSAVTPYVQYPFCVKN